MPPVEAVLSENEQLKEENILLREQIAWLRKQLFGGGKGEKLDEAQLKLKLEEMEARLEEQKTQKVTYERNVGQARKSEPPKERFKDLPVQETVVIEPDEVKADPELYERIGEEKTFEVDITPPKLWKREIVRPKYRFKLERERPPVIAPALPRPVEGGYASAGLLAWVVLSKYMDHRVPRVRMSKMAAHSCATVQPMRDVAPRERSTETVLKSPLAAEVKSLGRERKGKKPKKIGQMSDREMNESEPSMTCRNVSMIRSKPEGSGCSGISREEVCIADPMACGMKVA